MKCNFLLRSNVPISPGKLISNRKVIAADTIHDSFMGDTLQIKNNLKGSGTEIERTRTSLRRNVLECGKYVFFIKYFMEPVNYYLTEFFPTSLTPSSPK